MKKINKYYVWFGILSILYLVLTFVIPPDASTLRKYSLSVSQARALGLTVVLPIVGIWFVAFYGFIAFRKYSNIIKNTKEGKQLSTLSQGLMYLVISLPITSILASGFNYISSKRPDLTAKTVIINNYISLLLILVAFYLIYRGAVGLYSTLTSKSLSHPSARELTIAVGFTIISMLYVYATLTSPARRFETMAAPRATYYLPDYLIVITMLVPYLLVWAFGIASAYYIQQYSQKVKGSVYRSALVNLSNGLIAVIVSLILIRFLTAWTTHLNNLSLKFLLALLYALLIIIAVGYGFIAVGAKKLKKIEEV